MLSLSLPVQIFLCVLPTDMRRGFDGLMRMAQEHLQQNVLDGGLFVFVNRRRDRVKLLYWDGDGLCVWYKNHESQRPGWFLCTEFEFSPDNQRFRASGACLLVPEADSVVSRRRVMSEQRSKSDPPRAGISPV